MRAVKFKFYFISTTYGVCAVKFGYHTCRHPRLEHTYEYTNTNKTWMLLWKLTLLSASNLTKSSGPDSSTSVSSSLMGAVGSIFV